MSIINTLKESLTEEKLQYLSNCLHSIDDYCSNNDGCGLTGGLLSDMLITEFLKIFLKSFETCHKGECDCKILDIPLSLKKIKGKSNLALNWSKNPKKDLKEKFTADILIFNIKSVQWWKTRPKKKIDENVEYNTLVKSGIYLIDKEYCKEHVKLSKNNKTNSLITSQYLYLMLFNSKLFILDIKNYLKIVFRKT